MGVKYKRQGKEYDAEEFDSTKPLIQWPDGVVEDIASSTGYRLDTREIAHGQYVLTKSSGTRLPIDGDKLNAKYELK